MPPTYTLSVPDPQPGIPPGDRWCALSGPRAPLPSILASADEWLLIAGAIEAGAPRAFGRVAFAPAAGGGELWSPHNSTGDRDHVRLTTAELVELAADVRAKLAPPDRAGCPAPIEATAEEMGALLAIAARPRQTDPTNPDVTTSAPRPTVADRPSLTDAIESHRVAAIAEHAVSTGRASIRDVRAAVVALQDARDAVVLAATPPTLPADLRGLLDALVAAKDAIDAGDLHDLGHILRLDAYEEAVGAVAEWHRGAGDVDAEPAPAPLSDGELISLWGQYVGSPPSPNGMTLMRAIRDHAGGGR